MKKHLVILSFVVVFSLMAGFAFAAENMRIDVPFAFYMGNQLFPAGQYQFGMTHGNYATASFVKIRAPKGTYDRLLMTTAGMDENANASQLVFNKYGHTLILSTISINGYKATLKVQNLERELRSQAEKAPEIIRIALK